MPRLLTLCGKDKTYQKSSEVKKGQQVTVVEVVSGQTDLHGISEGGNVDGSGGQEF